MSDTATIHPIVSKVLNTAAGKSICDPKAACPPCHRTDLQLLVITPSVAPKAHAQALQDAGYFWSPSFDAEFSNIKREATVPVARLMRTGYVYLYYVHRDRWDIWQVMHNGHTRKILHQVNRDQYAKGYAPYLSAPEPKVCSQGAANVPAHLISVQGALGTDQLWIAYSPRPWSPAVLQRFADNPVVDLTGPDGKPAGQQKLRTIRGREINPKAILNGSPAHGSLPLTAATLQHHIVEYCADKTALWPTSKFGAAFATALQPLTSDRLGQAQAFDAAVRVLERASGPTANRELYVNKSLVLMVPDDVGVIEQHNHLRLCAKEARQAWVAGAPDFAGRNDDPLRAWKLRSSLHAEMIEAWVEAENLRSQQTLLAAGAYRRHTIISGFEYQKIVEQEKRTGELVNPPGTTYEHLPGSPDRYRATWPDDYVEQGIEGIAHARSTDRLEHYRKRLRQTELTQFRQAFQTGLTSWESHLNALDADYVSWLTSARLAITLRYDFDSQINLLKLNAAHGDAQQQVAEVLARIEAIDKAWGGGALTPISARQLARLYDKAADAPAHWINSALLAPFGYAQAIIDDKGKQKDTAEKLNGLVNEMPQLVKAALHAAHTTHAGHVQSLNAVSEQAAHLQATLIDADRAKALGLATITADQVKHTLTVQIRTAVLLDLVTNPAAERYVTIGVKLPVGEALDKLGAEFRRGTLDMDIQTKTDTSRAMRRRTRSDLRKLATHAHWQGVEYQSVMLTEKRLMELEKLATQHGDDLVDVIADGVLGKSLPQSFRLPRSTALNLIGEQASLARASAQAIWSRQGATVGVLGLFQLRALIDALGKLDAADGYAHTDALMAVFSSSAGLTEGGLALVSGYYSIKTEGSRLVLASTATRAALVRLTAGVAGAAAMAFDAVAMYAKYKSAKSRGSREAMQKFGMSSVSFGVAATSLLGSTALSFANATTTRFVVSEVVITRLGGAAAAELVGASLTGMGIVLGIAGFAYALYAESLEDDLNDVFLKRSYWGHGETAADKFGGAVPDLKDAHQQLNWARQGLQQEQRGFKALSVGFKATLEWQHNTFKADVLQARIESALSNDERRLAYTLTVFATDATQPLLKQTHRDIPLNFDKDSGRYVADIKVPLDEAAWKAAHSARFDYNVYEHSERISIARDQLSVKKP